MDETWKLRINVVVFCTRAYLTWGFHEILGSGCHFYLCYGLVSCGSHLVRHVVASFLFRWEYVSIIRNVAHWIVACALIVS